MKNDDTPDLESLNPTYLVHGTIINMVNLKLSLSLNNDYCYQPRDGFDVTDGCLLLPPYSYVICHMAFGCFYEFSYQSPVSYYPMRLCTEGKKGYVQGGKKTREWAEFFFNDFFCNSIQNTVHFCTPSMKNIIANDNSIKE